MANTNCDSCNDSIFNIPSLIPEKKVIVASGDVNIVVNTVEAVNDITYYVSYTPYAPLTIQSFITNIPLQIKGAVITDYILNWEYNIPVAEHSLDNGLVPPPVTTSQLVYQLNVGLQNITDNLTITLIADDDINDINIPVQSSTSILFGNFLYIGNVTITDTGSYDPSEADIKLLSSTLAVNAKGANPIPYTNSGVNEYQIFAAPSNSPFIVNNFQDSGNPSPGGFVQVKTLDITNSEGYTEQYTVWRTTYDNTAGTGSAGNPLTFSII